MIKKSLYLGIFGSLILSTSCFANFNEEDISTYSQLKVTSVGHEQLDGIFKDYHKDFLKQVKTINKEMDNYEKDIMKQISRNVKDADKAIKDNQKTYDKNCKDVKSEEEHKQCETIKESIFNTEQKKKGIEVEKENFKNKIATDRKNRLRTLYVNYKNLVGKQKAEYESRQ